MSASNFIELYNFSEIFEEAALGVLSTAGVEAYGACSKDDLPINRASVRFTPGPATEDFAIITTGGKLEHYRYTGCMLEIEVHWDRAGDNIPADTLREINQTAATIRSIFRRSEWPFDDTNLQFYRVTRLTPAGESLGQDQQRFCDVLTLRFSIDFEILSTAWPSQA